MGSTAPYFVLPHIIIQVVLRHIEAKKGVLVSIMMEDQCHIRAIHRLLHILIIVFAVIKHRQLGVRLSIMSKIIDDALRGVEETDTMLVGDEIETVKFALD